jgi:hypothetical protein
VLQKTIKSKATEGPLVSHHSVFRPHAPAVAIGPPPPPVLTVPPCPTIPPRFPRRLLVDTRPRSHATHRPMPTVCPLLCSSPPPARDRPSSPTVSRCHCALVSCSPWFHHPTTCAVHHLALSAAASRSQSLLLLFTLPTTRSALQWPPQLPPHATVNRVLRCLAVRFAGPRRVAEHRPNPEPSPRVQSSKSSNASATRHLLHGHLVNDHLVQPPSGAASTSTNFPSSPRSSTNPEPTTTTTERPPHRCSSPLEVCHRAATDVVSNFPPYCLQSVHLDAGVLCGYFPHCLAPPAHWISATGQMAATAACAHRRAHARDGSWEPTEGLGHQAGSAC